MPQKILVYVGVAQYLNQQMKKFKLISQLFRKCSQRNVFFTFIFLGVFIFWKDKK